MWPCETLADVGTDHALLPLAAVQRGLSQRALAVDSREAPLRSARRNVERAALAQRVELIRGDGLTALEGRGVDAVVMAGLSGRSMERLCGAAPHVLAALTQLVLQPNQNAATLRAWALESGWHLRDEVMVEERGRAFVTCAFVPGAGRDPAYRRADVNLGVLCKVGPLLLARKDALARSLCKAQCERLGELESAGDATLQAELVDWRAAWALMR